MSKKNTRKTKGCRSLHAVDGPQLSEEANEALRWMGESTEAGRMTDQEKWKLCCQRWGEGVRAELDVLKLRSIADFREPAEARHTDQAQRARGTGDV